MWKTKTLAALAGALPLLTAAGVAEAARETQPQWAAKPTDAQKADAWAAVRGKHGARALARCTPDAQGLLQNCRILVDFPAKHGAAEALKRLIPHYRLVPGAPTQNALAGDVLVHTDSLPFDEPADWGSGGLQIFTRYPDGALAAKSGGAVLVNCLVGRMGKTYDCHAVAENPPDLGFGWRAVRAATFMKFKPARLNGKAVPSHVTIPLNFAPQVESPPAEPADGR